MQKTLEYIEKKIRETDSFQELASITNLIAHDLKFKKVSISRSGTSVSAHFTSQKYKFRFAIYEITHQSQIWTQDFEFLEHVLQSRSSPWWQMSTVFRQEASQVLTEMTWNAGSSVLKSMMQEIVSSAKPVRTARLATMQEVKRAFKSPKLSKNYDKNQKKIATQSFRKDAMNAYHKGLSTDELHDILRECLTQSVIET